MSEAEPLLVFVPPRLQESDRESWVASLLTDLESAGVVTADTAGSWRAALRETAAAGLHPIAVGQILMILPGAEPIFVWVTVGEAPAERLASMVDAIGSEFTVDAESRRFRRDVRGVPVELGLFVSRVPTDGALDGLYGLAAAAATLDLGEIGPADTCVWCISDQVEQLDSALPVLAGLVRDPDLVTYLTA